MNNRTLKKYKWDKFTKYLILISMIVSVFFIHGNNLVDSPLQSVSATSYSVSISIGVSYGTQMQIDFGSTFSSSQIPEMLITSVPVDNQLTQTITEIEARLNQISDLSILALTSISIKLYSLRHSSKEQKNWTNNRLLIKSTISDNPGISFRSLSRQTGLAIGSTQYWLRILKQDNEIDALFLGKSKHFFDCKQQLSLDEKILFSLLQNQKIRDIIELLHDYPSITSQKELCEKLGLNKSLLSYYMKILKKHRIINTDSDEISISDLVKNNYEKFN